MMASDSDRIYAHCVFKRLALFHWFLVICIGATNGLAIHFAEGTSGYWGGALAAAIMLFFTSIQDTIIVTSVLEYNTDSHKRKSFIDTFNFYGIIMFFTCIACCVGTGISIGLGAVYGMSNHNSTQNSINTTDIYDDGFVNVKENRIVGLLLAIMCAVAVTHMIRTMCLHGQVRDVLSVPKNSTAPEPPKPQTQQPGSSTAPEAAPQTQPPVQTSTTAQTTTPNTDNKIQKLTTQNDQLKRQNQLQKVQLDQLKDLYQRLQIDAAVSLPGSVPHHPPDYGRAGITSPPPEYQTSGYFDV